MKLLLPELKRFKANASFIKQNNILPVLAFIKIENGSITKSNLQSFVTQKISAKGDPILIEERILNNFIDNCKSEEIELKIKGKFITLSSEGMPSVKSETGNIAEFPITSKPEAEPVLFDEHTINQISIASKFIDENSPNLPATCLFIGDGMICASDGFIAYGSPLKSIENVFIPKTTAIAISKFKEAMYSESNSYHFFESGDTLFGFSKPEMKYMDIRTFFNVPENLPLFKVNKQHIVSFNDMAISNGVSKAALTKMDVLPGSLSLDMNDTDYNVEQSISIPIDGGQDGSIGYNPTLLNRLLKAIPGDDITVHQMKGRYYITGEGYTTLIMELKTQ